MMAIDLNDFRLPEELYVFRNANKEWLNEESYSEILKRFIEIWDKHIMDKRTYPAIVWTETEMSLMLYHEITLGAFHDEASYESIRIVFERESDLKEEPEWKESSDWPCEGEALVKDGYDNKLWLMKKPYGMPGVWRLEYEKDSWRD